ncbi:putative transposable element [Pseudoloma neurophilia]|uniref:Putative transposable element n=1 Tax=Pseudoloma neurophilia TaxID=146866 RepID=A0A0R0LYX9_9MICR|nr:putative transposable element [Pseudoloma neurophilia]
MKKEMFENVLKEKHSIRFNNVEEDITFINYNDSKPVKFLTTKFTNQIDETRTREWAKTRDTNRKRSVIITKQIPPAISCYNQNMNGVDRFNQSIKSSKLKRASKKFDRKLSVFLLESILHNAFILLSSDAKMKYQTKHELIESLADLFMAYE